MEVQIKYPKAKCAYCGKPFTKTHNRQTYCSEDCRKKGYQEKNNTRWRRWYHKNKNTLYQRQLGTRTIGPHKHPDTDREKEIIGNEKQRLINSNSFDYNMKW